MKTEIVFYYRGRVERGNGKPGYDWHDGYSTNTPDGKALFPWMTQRECQAQAKSDGGTAVFKTEAKAQ